MSMRSIARAITFAAQNMRRNIWLSIATITVFLLTLLTVNAALCVSVLADAAATTLEEGLAVDIYFLPGTSEETVAALRGYLSGLPQVRDIQTITAEDALAQFRAAHANDPAVLASLDEVEGNPLGDALRVGAHDAADLPFLVDAAHAPEFSPHLRETVADDAAAESVARLDTLSAQVRSGTIAVAIFFSLIAMLMVINTVRVTTYVRREDIAVMKLVGAKDSLVRAPFLIEIVVDAAIATALAAGIVLVAVTTWSPALQTFFGSGSAAVSALVQGQGLQLFGAQFLGLALIGCLVSAIAMRRYLRMTRAG